MIKQVMSMTVPVALLVAPECLSKTITLYVDWDQARAIWGHGDFRRSVKVTLHSSKPLKGKLAGIPDLSACIRKSQSEIAVSRDDVRAIRLVPSRPSNWDYRLLAIMGGIPAGLDAAYGALALFRADIDGSATVNNAVVFSAWGATPYPLSRLSANADRGALVLVLPAADSAEARSTRITPSIPGEERP